MKAASEIQLTAEQEAIKINSDIYKNFTKKIVDIINRYKVHLCEIHNIEQPSDSDEDYSSDEEQPTRVDPVEKAILQDEIGKLLLSLYNQLNADLPLHTSFKFDAAASLIQACLNNKIHPSFKEDVLNICHLQFYLVLILKVDYLIQQYRRYAFLLVHITENKEKIDPLNTNNIGKLLLSLRTNAKNGFNPSIQPFNYATLIALYKQLEQDDATAEIINTISEIYHMIINDILNYNEGLQAHFYYDQIDCENAVSLLTSMANAPQKYAIGPATWRICFGLKQKEGDALVKKYPELIYSVKKLNPFQSFDPFERAPHVFFAHIIENPWVITFFTKSHLLNFFIHAASDNNLQIIEIINTLNKAQALESFKDKVSIEALQVGKSLFSVPAPDEKGNPVQRPLLSHVKSSFKNFFSPSASHDIAKPVQFPMLSAVQKNKKTIANFLAINDCYSKAVINEIITSREFYLLNGTLFIELIPLLTPSTIVDLFLEFDNHIPNKVGELKESSRKNGIDITITAQIARDFVEFQLLLKRIENDIKNNLSISEYCNGSKTIPYLLYELVLRDSLLSLPLDHLSTIFSTLNPEIILETLQLLDPQDKINQIMHLNKKVQNKDLDSDQYEVDKNTSLTTLQKLTQILLSDNFKHVRQQWSLDPKAVPLIVTYPFLLRDLDFSIIERFIADNKDKILNNAFTCLKNEINSYTCCPALLTFLVAEDIIGLYKKFPAVRELFKYKKLSPEVIIYHIQNKSFEILIKNIPELNNYLDYAFFEKTNKQLLNEQLLTAMIHPNSETTRIALRNFPLITNLFDQNTVSACAINSTFLRQILRQVLMLQIIEDNFDDLLNVTNIELLKGMIRVLYSNQASNTLLKKIITEITKIQHASQETREELKHQNPDEDIVIRIDDMIAISNKKYDFSNVSTYLSERIFDEHQSLDEIESPPVHRNKYDPVVRIFHDIIICFPSRVRQIIQSKGTYPALKEYCLKALAKAADDTKRINDHYPAILQYASLLIDEKQDYEEAAAYLEEYIDYLGLSRITAKSNPSVYDLLITCADGLLKMSCDEHIQNSDAEKVLSYQNKALYYYHYIATALLAAEPVKILTQKLPLQCLEEDLTDLQKKRLMPAMNILNAIRQRQKMVIDFATKSIELMHKTQLEKQTLLALISLVYILLLKTSDANYYSSDFHQHSLSLKDKLFLLAINIFNKSYHELSTIFESQQAILNTHVVYKKLGATKIHLPTTKKIWQKSDDERAIEREFFHNLAQFFRSIHKLIKSNTLLFDYKNPMQHDTLITHLLSLFNTELTNYNQKHKHLLPVALDILRNKIDIHDQLEHKGKYANHEKNKLGFKGFATIQQHLQKANDEQTKAMNRKKIIENTNTSTINEKKIFSPYSPLRVDRDVKDAFDDLVIFQPAPKEPSQKTAFSKKGKPVKTSVPLVPNYPANDNTAANKDDVVTNPMQISTDISEETQLPTSSDVQQGSANLSILTMIEQDKSLEDLEQEKANRKKAKQLEKQEKKLKKDKHKQHIKDDDTLQEANENQKNLQQAKEASLKQQHDEELKKLEEERLRIQKEAEEQEKQYQLALQKAAEDKAALKRKEDADVKQAKLDAIEKEKKRKELKDKMEQELKFAHDEFTKAIEQARLKEQQLKASKNKKDSDNMLTEEELAATNKLVQEKEQRLKSLNDKKSHDKNLAEAAKHRRLHRSLSTSSLKTTSTITVQKNKNIDIQSCHSIAGIKTTDQKMAALKLEEQQIAREERRIAREEKQIKEEQELLEEEKRLAKELEQVDAEERALQLRKTAENNKKTTTVTSNHKSSIDETSPQKLTRSMSVGNLNFSGPTTPNGNQSSTETKTTSSSHTDIKRSLKDHVSKFEEEARKRNAEKEAIASRVEEKAKARARQANDEQTLIIEAQIIKGTASSIANFSGIYTNSKDQTAAISSSAVDNKQNTDLCRIAQAGVSEPFALSNKK